MTHICVSKITIIGSDDGLSAGRRQAIIWTNDGIILIGYLGANFTVILIEIYTFAFKKIHMKMSSAKRRPYYPGLNVLSIRYLSCFLHRSFFFCQHDDVIKWKHFLRYWPLVQQLVESSINSASDWRGEYGDTRWPSLHTRLLDAGHM